MTNKCEEKSISEIVLTQYPSSFSIKAVFCFQQVMMKHAWLILKVFEKEKLKTRANVQNQISREESKTLNTLNKIASKNNVFKLIVENVKLKYIYQSTKYFVISK